MPTSILKRPRAEDGPKYPPKKKVRKFKKQLDYHSSSSEDEIDTGDFNAVNLQDSDEEEPAPTKKTKFITEEDGRGDEEDQEASSEDEADADAQSDVTGASSSSDSETSTIVTANGRKQQKKRNDPTAFATSISKILSSKLTTTKRSDPVLSRSAEASKTSKALADSKLEARARQKIRADKKNAMEKGRVRDVLGLEDEERSTQAIMEQERKLKKTAQRGVVKLFNAVREAQKRGEEAKREALKSGVVGIDKREEKVSEMSKQGFLDLITSGGAKSAVKA